MATYYRWRQSTVGYFLSSYGVISAVSLPNGVYYSQIEPTADEESGEFTFQNPSFSQANITIPFGYFAAGSNPANGYYEIEEATGILYSNGQLGYGSKQWPHFVTQAGTFVGYVYSTTASAYPNGGVQGNYYYDQRTTITSPTAPTGLTYPNPITTPKVTVSWNAATSNVPDYPVDHYLLAYGFDSGQWKGEIEVPVGTTSYQFSIPAGTTQLKFSVFAYDTNNQRTQSAVGPLVPVYLAPTLTVPQMIMQGQQATIIWSAIEGADSYTLQRKSSADADWTQVYSGANLSYSETVGTWTSVQYRVQAVFSAGTGSWATSGSIPVISASALVISGSDGDLGTLVNDVPYTISTDTGNPISVRTTVNGAVIFAGEVESGAAKAIPVLDLVNGEGTIVIEASVETSSGTVSAARAWTYDKDLITFPNGGSPAQLTKEGKIVFPKTLAECVRLPGGRTLDKVMGFPCQIFVGSYVGTGTYGSANPNEVTTPFKPQIVFVSNGSVGTTIPMIRPLLKAESSAALTVAWTDDGVSWSATSAANQMNAKGTEYMVVAFG